MKLRRPVTPEVLAVFLLIALHLAAVFKFLPPTEILKRQPPLVGDYPVHTHRVHMYRAGLLQSGLPWGYDPEVSAGAVMNPGQDLGAKPIQVLGILLPFLSPGTVVRLFLVLTALTFPLWIVLACRRLDIVQEARVWILLVVLAVGWLDWRIAGYLHWGLVGFVASAYFSVYALALFLDFLARPTLRGYVVFCLSASCLFLLHVLGPVVILLPLVLYSISARFLEMSWRIALMLVPLVVAGINFFWLVPFLSSQNLPQPAGMSYATPPGWERHLVHQDWSELISRLDQPLEFGPLLLGLALATYGLVALSRTIGRRESISLGLAAASGLLLTYLGSFMPLAARAQPVRFLVPAFAFLTIPVGYAIASVIRRSGLRVTPVAAVVAVSLAIGAVWSNRPVALPLPSAQDSLGQFILSRTDPSDRLLVQSSDGFRSGGFETKILPLLLGRETVGCNFPVVWDPVQFLSNWLLGRELAAWSPQELREALSLWGVTWAFTITPEARALMAGTITVPGEQMGEYTAFRIPQSPTRFLVGSGSVRAEINRLDLAQLSPEKSWIVLRYRYHPAWTAAPQVPIYQFPLAGDPAGLIALKNPPESLTLRFRPWAMLGAPWPEEGSSLRLPGRELLAMVR